MVTQNEIIALARNGITFRLSNDGRFANMYYKDKFVDVLHNSNNKLYVCGKTLVGITCKELLNFLATHQCEVEIRKDLDDEEIFEIWKKSILEKRSASTFDKSTIDLKVTLITISRNCIYLNLTKKLTL